MSIREIIKQNYNRRHYEKRSGPVFIDDTEYVVSLRVGRKDSRPSYAQLSPKEARTLAYALLLQAEKVELHEAGWPPVPKKLDKAVGTAVKAVVQLNLGRETLQEKIQERRYRELSGVK